MKKLLATSLVVLASVVMAQSLPRVPARGASSVVGEVRVHSRKGVLIEKQVFGMGKFKHLTIQKIVSKDTSDSSTEGVLGIMTEYKTYDAFSQRTLTIDKTELSKLIESLSILYQKENNRAEVETKYKFRTSNNIEFGGVYNAVSKGWENYITLPSRENNIYGYSREELKELIDLLKKVEKEL
ncbi:hypothetical protein [Bergeyella sp. RCAD1439]|uniref:hypothetical protein n=1 Tax=Bergeyella anatis TaxID=3113737 RepID=UPI002E192DB3|nr:hypothetical protein [Bergeyella sp. RCAD1439]